MERFLPGGRAFACARAWWMVVALGLVGLAGCTGSSTTSGGSAAGSGGSTGTQGSDASVGAQGGGGSGRTIAWIRLNDPQSEIVEPDFKDVADGLKYDKFERGKDYDFKVYDAQGDASKLAGLVSEAVATKPTVILAMHPAAIEAAAAGHGDVPLVFMLLGDKEALGLDQGGEVTGVATSTDKSYLVEILMGAQPQAKKLGLIYNPDIKVSAGDKDALNLRNKRGDAELLLAEYRTPEEAVAATQKLLDQGIEGLVIVRGIGEASKPVIEAAMAKKVPVYGYRKAHVEQGAFIAREHELRFGGFEAGRKIGAIFRGSAAKSLKIQPGEHYETYASKPTSEALKLTVPGFLRGVKIVEAGGAASERTVTGDPRKAP